MRRNLLSILLFVLFLVGIPNLNYGQGVTTASMNGLVLDVEGQPLPGANVVVVHEPTGRQFGASTRGNGQFNVPNIKVGGPYSVTVSFVGYVSQKQENIYLKLGQNLRLDFNLESESLEMEQVVVEGQQDDVFNSTRTGAATYIKPEEVTQMPSIKRSTRDLTRLDPRSDGNFSFGGKNWLFNNVSLDGSYFNNPFGLDDPLPGGQTNAEPVPFDAVEQVQVSVAPFDVREGGFTGAGINTVTKSGTNRYKASIYSFARNESLLGTNVSGNEVIANPDLSFNQSGFTVSGPIIPNKLFFFINGEIERRDDAGTNFNADTDGNIVFGESRVSADVMNRIRQRMIDVFDYDPGPYQGYINETNNEKLLVKLNWNIDDQNDLSLRYNFLDALRDLPPHPFVLSVNGSGRGPNENSLPFKNAGYRINNELHSFALEVNSRYETFANRFFASYNRFRDFREPFTEAFPTVEIGQDGITYTTLGTEPFSAHNILDQDVWQFTNNLSLYSEDHVYTIGANFEYFSFFNSFNIFRHGVFFLPYFFGIGSTFSSVDEFMTATDPNNPDFFDLGNLITPQDQLFKGEDIEVGQLSLYAQDEWLVNKQLSITYGLRIDFPFYFTDPIDNPFSRGLNALDENDKGEIVDQSKLPGRRALYSPRIGFNYDLFGDRTTQVRGGTGIFTGRVPFVWIGNVISNPGNNPNLFPNIPADQAHLTQDNSSLQTSFDLNTMDKSFTWPQVWNTNFAVDHKIDDSFDATVEFLYGKDLNSIYVRNADLKEPERMLPDGRPYYGAPNHELNPDGNAGIYVIDNSSRGYHYNITAQLRKRFNFGLNSFLSYSFTQARSLLKSTEIASVLWSENPVQGDPNDPELSFSEFGQRHRIIGGATYRHIWSENAATSFGLFFEVAEGNRFAGAGGNRYSYTYAGDVNGDGSTANDLIYIPRNSSEIVFTSFVNDDNRTVSPEEQWENFNAFIEQDDYLSENRGEIAERFGGVNPWYFNIDLRVLQDFSLMMGSRRHTFQLSVDILNVANLISSDWGVREVASATATVPLEHTGFDDNGAPTFNYKANATETFVDDPGLFSRWQMQVGLRYFFD